MAPGTGEPPRRRKSAHRKRHRPESLPPYKFDPTRADTIIQFLRAGAFIETAAAAAGISKQTLYNWLERGLREHAKSDNPPLAAWAAEAMKAQALSEVAMVSVVGKAAQMGVWQAAAWHLERKFPERWGRRESVEHTGPGGGPLTTKDLTKHMTSGEKRARMAELLTKFQERQAADRARQAAADEADDAAEAGKDAAST